MRNILISIDQFAPIENDILRKCESLGLVLHQNNSGRSLNFVEDNALFLNADYVIAGLETFDAEFFARCQRLKCISRVGVGTDNIDLEAARAANVKICITSDHPSVAVAELCVGNMISLLRHTHTMSEALKAGHWQQIQGKELRNCCVGVVGLGSIGKELVRRLRPFGCKIVAASRSWNSSFAESMGVERVSLETIFQTCNIVSVHLPLEEDTRGIISGGLIRSMPDKALIINTSRAGVMDNSAVVEALISGALGGVAIDVFDEEPCVKPYDNIRNAILSPHIGSHTRETRKAMEKSALDNIIEVDSLLQLDEQVTNDLANYPFRDISI